MFVLAFFMSERSKLYKLELRAFTEKVDYDEFANKHSDGGSVSVSYCGRRGGQSLAI